MGMGGRIFTKIMLADDNPKSFSKDNTYGNSHELNFLFCEFESYTSLQILGTPSFRDAEKVGCD
jgi:hypothetical protein